jgi:hypothetical protein
VELSAIVKVHKYKGFHEGHHFIFMAMEVHNTIEPNMDHFSKECARLFHNRRLGVIYLYLFAFNFLGNMLVLLFNVL